MFSSLQTGVLHDLLQDVDLPSLFHRHDHVVRLIDHLRVELLAGGQTPAKEPVALSRTIIPSASGLPVFHPLAAPLLELPGADQMASRPEPRNPKGCVDQGAKAKGVNRFSAGRAVRKDGPGHTMSVPPGPSCGRPASGSALQLNI